ncbi:MAG: NUDIX domain-containing protein [Sphingobacteriales bacterium]|nr:MAG: NUDIX domain-containing protein [Sphingobacteriales bacterium]
MYFEQKIYYNNKPLILTNDAREFKSSNTIGHGYMSFTGAFARNFRLAFQHLDKLGTLGAVIEDISPASLQKELHALYEPIDAGGGVVENEAGEILLIYRRGKWDLPKGKRDEGEDIAECALREVTEETGLHQLQLGEKICDTYHIYSQKKQNLLKCTAWYKMKGTSRETPQPQAEENILEAKWIATKDLRPLMYKSYEAIREVLHQGGVEW